MNINIAGFVDIYGQETSYNIHGIVDIVDRSNVDYKLYKNNKIYSITNPDDAYINIKKYQLTSGEEKLNNVKLQFIKGLIENQTNVKTQNIKDECITDQEGYYYPILDDGNYSINIIGGKYSRLIHNQYFETNIDNKFYIDIDGLIKERNGGTLTIYDSDYKLIVGKIINQNKKTVPSEIIVSQDDKIFVRYITDENGNYRFALKNGVYDIRIKSDKYFKLIKNVNFSENIDFIKLISGDINEY